MFKLPFYISPLCKNHKTPDSHPESVFRSDTLLSLSAYLDCIDVYYPTELIDYTFLTAIHERNYLESLNVNAPTFFDSDTIVTPSSFHIAHLAASACCHAIESISKDRLHSFIAFRPPGHHAETNKAMGFCLLNTVAIAAKYAQQKGFKNVCIIDFDVHHGNGTQHIFETDPSILYVSSHQYPFFPGTGDALENGIGMGKHFTVNWPLPAYTTDSQLLDLYEQKLPLLLSSFNPDLILISAGYDIHNDDPLGGFCITDAGIDQLILLLLELTWPIPMIFNLEGGYNLEMLTRNVSQTCRRISLFNTLKNQSK
tara:strand:- start:82 stop:1017 length:936 start_codon:yes stop_codon:yes gene_type:complete